MSITSFISGLFNFDRLALILITLIAFISLTISFFAFRYLKGDHYYRRFFIMLIGLTISAMIMVSAENIWLLLAGWSMSNTLLVMLMIHKSQWQAARASGLLAAKNFFTGFLCSSLALIILHQATGYAYIHTILQTALAPDVTLSAAILLLIGAMTQSAIWPFHQWLTSSLNVPTPVSAVMHAGLVSGGGFLLTRFAPLYFWHPPVLNVIFILGLMTAITGTLWKLLQNDIKRMLACSTMGQMGLMLAQCGLGLFPAAIAHLCWHGVTKAYFFLNSGSAAQEKRLSRVYHPHPVCAGLALLCGIVGSFGFAKACHQRWFVSDTTFVLQMLALIAATQFALTILTPSPFRRLLFTIVITTCMGWLYGFNVYVIETWLAPLHFWQPQPLNAVYIIGVAVLFLSWFGFLYVKLASLPKWMVRLYVLALNASQPHPVTKTKQHNSYQYLEKK